MTRGLKPIVIVGGRGLPWLEWVLRLDVKRSQRFSRWKSAYCFPIMVTAERSETGESLFKLRRIPTSPIAFVVIRTTQRNDARSNFNCAFRIVLFVIRSAFK